MDLTRQSCLGAAASAFLVDRINYERAVAVPYGAGQFKLDRMRELLGRLGDPQAGLPIVHVAGTKGKGSTSAMIAAVLSAAGFRTGLYTSPHLQRVEERMMVDGQACSSGALGELVDRIRPVVTQMDAAAAHCDPPECGPTYFDLTTALALLHFVRRSVDIAVLEVGLGGRLDSTNVCQPAVSAITSISFDHMQQLGYTLAEIAREKAGIIKPGVAVISGVTDEEPRLAILEVCAARGSPLLQLGRDFQFVYRPPRAVETAQDWGRIDYRSRSAGRPPAYDDLVLGLLGRHQGANAAVALAALGELARQGWRIPEEAIRGGLAGVRWPARIEVVGRHPAVVVDAAHNVASVEALLATLDESFSARRRVLVFATTQEKDIGGMLALLLPRFDRVIFTRYMNNPRGVAPEELAALAPDFPGAVCTVCPEPAEAWDEVGALVADDDLVCITGSLFIAAQMRWQAAARPLGRSDQLALEPA